MLKRTIDCYSTGGGVEFKDSPLIKEKALECKKMAQQMRIKMLDLASGVNGSMHWGGDFSSAEILAVLYKEVLNCKNKNLSYTEKDKFILLKGMLL